MEQTLGYKCSTLICNKLIKHDILLNISILNVIFSSNLHYMSKRLELIKMLRTYGISIVLCFIKILYTNKIDNFRPRNPFYTQTNPCS